jgi:hypothetical protein
VIRQDRPKVSRVSCTVSSPEDAAQAISSALARAKSDFVVKPPAQAS